MNSEQELKVSRMTKWSSSKNIFTRDSFKLREFVLTPFYIIYYEVSGNNRGKEKGRINLSLIKYVESVLDGEIENRKNVFQLSFVEERVTDAWFILYIIAGSETEREDWISLLRFYSKIRNSLFFPRFHPGVWKKPGRYGCCDDICRRSLGCELTSDASQTIDFISEKIKRTSINSNSLMSANPNPRNSINQSINIPFVAMMNGAGAGGCVKGPNRNSSHSLLIGSSYGDKKSKPFIPNQLNNNNSFIQSQSSNITINNSITQVNFEKIVDDDSVIAIHNYSPCRENQLPLTKGEKYQVIDRSNAHWWYVKNASGISGYVPTNYVQKPNSLNSFDWYYKDITRQQAESILLEENREGCFLVRDSVSKKNSYTLSVTSKDPDNQGKFKVHHYRILRTDDTSNKSNNDLINNNSQCTTPLYYLSEKHSFPDIAQVIHYHKHNSGGLVVRLRSPPIKDKECPTTAGMGLDEFELDPAELKIEKVPIGKGQFGVVKKGTFRNITVAIKQMVEGAMNEEDFIEEAKNMRFLNHPNLVQLFGVVLKRRPIMIITEYMQHGSLRDFLKKNQATYEGHSTILSDVCAQVANGMAYLEKEQYVHRDLAARNCLVKSVSQNSIHVKVADFGMARFLLDNVYEPSAGTKFPVRWAPPEVFQSTYTARADVWSFAVLMWEIFTCCCVNPYSGMNNSQVYKYIVNGGRLEKPASCGQQFYLLMLDCWNYDFNKRPDFETIRQRICSYLENENVQ